MIKKDYKNRVIFIFILFVASYFVILGQLFLIQIMQKDFFKNLASQQYRFEFRSSPERAQIKDCSGTLLAFNHQVPSAFLLTKQLETREKTLGYLKDHFELSYKKIEQNPERSFLWVDRKINSQIQEKIKTSNIKDIQFISENQRFYPFPAMAHTIGFTDIDNVGIAGVELEFSKKLEGKPCNIKIERDARFKNFYFEKQIEKEGCKSNSVTLTIDHSLQFLVQEELEATISQFNASSGSILVMNPDNGQIQVMANFPTFDPNEKINQSLEITKNNIVTECYEMGSVMKMFSALAALEEGVVKIDEIIDCEGKFAYIDKFRVENWKDIGKYISFNDVIRHSNNVGIAKVAKRLDDRLYDHFEKLGFGKRSGIEFPGEREGFVNHPAYWSRSSIIVMSFGYEIMATLLQLGVATSIIANGGYWIKPTIIKTEKPLKKGAKLYKDSTINQIKDVLESVGSAFSIKGVRVMGKTGTARLVKDGQYSKSKHIYSFAGIIEKDGYKRVIIAFVKEPEKSHLWAHQVTGPLFKRVAEVVLLKDLFDC
jgi:cell division protein FtsI/penicillin-binding protein 2